jgi:hypothetical protein
MVRNKGATQDATQLLAQLTQRAAMLRDRAQLDASHAELQDAAQAGQLVARQRLKLHDENGHTRYEPGQQLPRMDIQHALLQPDKRLVTTASRWQAMQEYKALSAYLQEGRVSIQAKLHNATTAYMAAQNKVKQLQSELAEAQEALRQAETERLKIESELRDFAKRAPA